MAAIKIAYENTAPDVVCKIFFTNFARLLNNLYLEAQFIVYRTSSHIIPFTQATGLSKTIAIISTTTIITTRKGCL